MKVRFHPEALVEYKEAARYYAGCQEGLEARFVGCVEAAINRIAEAPQTWRVMEPGVRRYLVRVFPYTVLYIIESEFVLIVAVMHCHRTPDYWRHRVPRTD